MIPSDTSMEVDGDGRKSPGTPPLQRKRGAITTVSQSPRKPLQQLVGGGMDSPRTQDFKRRRAFDVDRE